MSTSWRETASIAAQQDVMSLINAALDMTVGLLEEKQGEKGQLAGEVPPFVISMDLSGLLSAQVVVQATPVSPRENYVQDLVDFIFYRAPNLQAALLVESPGSFSEPVLKALGDHREAGPFRILMEWRHKPGVRLLQVVRADIDSTPEWLFP
jgi:hypothetical protein